MNRDLVVRKSAEIEIAEAIIWYEDQRPGLGRQLLENVESTIEQIAERPDSWPLWHPKRPYRKRGVAGFPYIVFYRIDPSAITIVALAHSSRKPGYWLEREG